MADEKREQKTDKEGRKHDAGYYCLRRGETITNDDRAAEGTVSTVGQNA